MASTGRMMRRRTTVIGVVLGAAVVAGAVVAVARPWDRAPECERTAEHPEWSIARQWDEALLDAIRRDLPAPTVHARNLYHTSAAMWDAWAAYEPAAAGTFVTEKASAPNVQQAREEAISYAAYRVLEVRYAGSIGASDTIPELDSLMESLCYPIDVTTTSGETPAALGNRIGQAVLDAGQADGAREADGYDSPGYEPVNEALVVDEPGTAMADPNRWQPLQLAHMVSQNGIPIENGTQQNTDPHWGAVTGFALPVGQAEGLPIDPGPPPYLHDPLTDQAFKDAAIEVIRCSGTLDPLNTEPIDISPASVGDNSLGTNDGDGRAVNPATGLPYAAEIVDEGDFTRALAEFWADGPASETPPGHWNVVANTVGDAHGADLRIGGAGEAVDRLEWDVKLYLALNGANHDAAIAAWGAKQHYDFVRPISMIRYMGGLGQSSDSEGPAYDPDGLPLVPGLVEVITPETTSAGGRHATLRGHEGEIALRAWSGNPDDPATDASGVSWIRAIEWVPYQRPTFVTPAFAGYVSGHSTFSRASAEVMTAFTGDEYFPGGLSEWTVAIGSLDTERGPSSDVTLQWATYADAADQAGLSRLYGGIHIAADDFAGRRMGADIGQAAWDRAQQFYAGQPASDS